VPTDSVDLNPVTLAAAAMIAQFSIVVIFVVGLLIIKAGEPSVPRYRSETASSELVWILLIFSVVTLGALLLTKNFARVWKPAFGYPSFEGFALSDSLMAIFTMNAICTSIVVHKTAGSRSSPFSAMFFVYPSLAIFLHEPVGRVLYYVAVLIVIFSLNLVWFDSRQEDLKTTSFGYSVSDGQFVYWFVSVAAFVLSMAIGLITR
jgi:hypothetical protein